MNNTLTIGGIISKGFELGLRNITGVAGAGVLWLLTFWIPYLNVGTTIGLIGIVVAMSKRESVSATQIFDPKYRKDMGEFFLLVAFMSFGTYVGLAFMVIPGLVIAMAWGQAPYLFFDRGLASIAAIKESNRITYGHKWTIFWGGLILAITMYVIILGVFYIFSQISMGLFVLFAFVSYVAFISISLGAYAHIYATLSEKSQTK